MITKHLENLAEEFASYNLARAGLLIAKPKFDLAGADLLAFLEMGDGVKFCRIQCKGRSLANSNSHITVPKAYVSPGFILFLYLDNLKKQTLYCFIESDIKQWRPTSRGEYRLTLNRNNISAKLERYRFDETKVRLIKTIISTAEVSGQFRTLIYGRCQSTAGGAETRGYATVRNPVPPAS